jgi:hypothetical protein
MPSPSYINQSPRSPSPLEHTLSHFTQGFLEDKKEQKETDALKEIYSQYQNDGKNIEKAIMAIQTRPGISPTTRVNSVNTLMKFQQHNQELQKNANKQLEQENKKLKEAEKARVENAQAREAEIADGVPEGTYKNFKGKDLLKGRKIHGPKQGSTALNAQAVPPEVADAIEQIVKENPEADADSLQILMDKANIPRGYSLSYTENRRRQDDRKAEIDQKNKVATRQEQLQFHKESEKYDEELMKNTRIAKKQIETVKNIEQAINSGKVKPSSWANIFKGFGKVGDKISEAILNGDQATILASMPQLLEGWKEVFGVRLSDADLKVLNDKLPSIGKSPEANKAILKIMKKYADTTLLRSEIAGRIKKENNDLRPLGYADKIEEEFDRLTQEVPVINPKTGKRIMIPAYKLSDAMKAGATLANE